MSKKKNCTYIGGQAVISGVMMRGKSVMATAVRDENGEIQTEAKRITPPEKRKKWMRFPFIRGVVNFVVSLRDGMGALLRSSEVAFSDGEEEAPSKFEKYMADHFKISVGQVLGALSAIIGVLLALALFLFLPNYLTALIANAAPVIGDPSGLYYNLIEGGFRLVIFLLYILFTLIFKTIRETYAYHGAEHKTINCYEHGMELTVENVKKNSRLHDRCGTSFLFLLLLISIVVYALINWALFPYIEIKAEGFGWANLLIQIAVKLVLLPVIAGVSYEILKFFAKIQSPLVLPVKWPGYLFQLLTTREPDEKMIECAITAFNKVLEMDADPEAPEKLFATETKLSVLYATMKRAFAEKGIDESDAEWILSINLKIPRSDLKKERIVTRRECREVLDIYEERLTGRPLWYIYGDTEFYGYTIKVDERVLIPRPETEILVRQAVGALHEGDRVLDLCTGSGAVAIAIAAEAAKDKTVSVTATDISADALEVAKENARNNKANVTFIESDLFENVRGRFNLITANPPYVPTAEIDTLQREVKDFEPRLALDGGKDGLDFYRRIAEKINRYLVHGGMLIVECGENQARDILQLFKKCDYAMIVKDLEGKERFLKIVV